MEESGITWLRRRLPEFLLEIFVVVFSILLALGVDQWRDRRAESELAERAHSGILNELNANKAELDSTIAHNLRVLERLMKQDKAGESKISDFSFSFAQLSSAAWHTAQGTKALQNIDFDVMLRWARVYELQTLYDRNQTGIVEQVGNMYLDHGALEAKTLRKRVMMQLATLHSLGRELSTQYASALAKKGAE